MLSLDLNLNTRSYRILIASGLLQNSQHWRALGADKVLVISDDNVAPLYLPQLMSSLTEAGLEAHQLVLPAGEQSKSWHQLEHALSTLLSLKASRRSWVIALGGGVIGDLAGLAAALYMRGISYAQCPTSLLAQVDSSVGGKTAINHPLGKNMIGAFHQPALVLMDTDTLATLPERQFSAGMAEVIKYALAFDAPLLAWLEHHGSALKHRPAELAQVLHRCCALKAAVVEQDETETGERARLNFGHTLAHAIETETSYGWLHGEAVASGMVLALALSETKLGLSAEVRKRTEQLLTTWQLPTTRPHGISSTRLLESMKLDKKGAMRWVLLDALGHSQHGITVAEQVVLEHLECMAEGEPC